MLLKTTAEALPALRRAVEELHDYDVPEWLHWPAAAEGAYGAWCRGQVGEGGIP
jgi:periplasmic divalent cation tolerance protein